MNMDIAKSWESEPVSSLIRHIVDKHHDYCRRELTRLESLVEEVVGRLGRAHAELRQIKAVFTSLSRELRQHLLKEEQTLFPYIERLEKAVSCSQSFPMPPYGSVANPIRYMILEHETSDAGLKEIRRLSGGYEAPEDADPAIVTLYKAFGEFERDMQEHTALEDRVVFPRAIALEKSSQK